ncbi:transposase family protein [Streptomyces sp. NPDC004250]|uniref:helix-turn-helix domain-containing protein n=1 Tax=Streptomyces sp. NPDC004250 TaxID=3364692 RepID=UPI0036AAE5D9
MGAGAKHRLVVVDRLLATLVRLRHGVTHAVPACWFGVDLLNASPPTVHELAEEGASAAPHGVLPHARQGGPAGFSIRK